MEILRALEFLKLRELPQVWVDTLWDLDFTESAILDAGLEEDIVASGLPAFRSLYKALLDHVSDEGSTAAAATDDATQSMWVVFRENGVSVKSLVAVLGYLVLGGKGKNASVQQRMLALHAASHYLLLLAVHGSISNKAFHQVLFDTCADIWSHCWPQDSTKKRKKEALKSSQSDGKRHKTTRRDQEEADEDEEEEPEEEVHISVQELGKIRDGVVLLMQSLLRLLHRFSLKDRAQSAIHCTQIFIKLIYFEPVHGEVTFSVKQDIDSLRTVPELAFHGLSLLCTPSHGDQKESIRRVFHRLLYVIVMMSKAGSGKPSLLLPSQMVLSAREHAISFVCQTVEELKELALPFLSILIQHICFRMVEKCDYRNYGSQAVGTLVGHLPCSEYATFIKWLSDYSNNAKMVYRLFSIDVVMVLLEQPERTAAMEEAEDAPLSPEASSFLAHKFLIHGLLFGRRKDSSPTVRSHALTCLARCLELPSFNVTNAVHSLFHSGSQTELEEHSSEESNRASTYARTYIPGSTSNQTSTQTQLHQTQKTYRTLPFRSIELTADSTASTEAKENVALLMRRIADPKTNVRKSALQAFMGLLKHGVIPLTSEHLREVSDRCRDPAVSVKKKALQCLAELIAAQPHSKLVQTAALRGFVPAVMDPESTVQEKALEQLDELILSQVKLYQPSAHLDYGQSLAWDLLGLLCTECRDLRRYFSRAFSVWSKQNKFTPAFMKKLLSHTEADHAAGAWLLLAQVAASSHNHISYGQILDCWDSLISAKDFNVTTCCHIMSVMGDIAGSGSLNEDTKFRVVEDIMSWLKAFDKPLEVISASLETLFQLGRCEDVRGTQAFLNQHCGELVSLSEAYLSSIILSENGTDNLNEDLMVKHLHTLGVASLHCPSRINKKIVLLVESIISTQNDSQPALVFVDDVLSGEDSLFNFNPKRLPTKVRAHGVITLGKFCLQNDELTRRHLPSFSMELEKGEEVCVRNNVLVVLCDLCVRYTNMVDRYVPNISASIRDPEPIIREQSLTMLTSLLQEEYIKWKGSLFFRFMVALVDPVPTISSLCEYCLLHLLLKKCPVMFSQHFIECIFHFNSYSKHKTYNKFYQTEREEALFSLKGPQNRNKRFQIYRFLLQHSDNVQRFNIYRKINDTVLVCFADEELALDADGADLLSEMFAVLSLEEMRLHSMFSSVDPAAARGEEVDEDANMAAQAVVQAAQNKLLSRLQKKTFMENIMPVIIDLKNLMQQKRSPVLRDLMSYLQVNMKELRDEMKQFFAADEQLMEELVYNLKITEKENQDPPPGCDLTPSPASPKTPNVRTRLPAFATPQPLRPRQTEQNRRLSLPLSLVEGANRKEAVDESIRRSDVQRPGARQYEMTVMSKGAALRAISTPAAAGRSDVTFGEGFSAILSDINSSTADTVGGPSLNLSQDQQAQGPRLWNVQSPLRPTKRRRRRKH